MKRSLIKLIPVILTASVTAVVSFLAVYQRSHPEFDLFRRLEWITYDSRVRFAVSAKQEVSPRLGASSSVDWLSRRIVRISGWLR